MSVRPRLFEFVSTDFVSLFLTLLAPISLGIAGWAALKLPVFTTERLVNEQPFERMDPKAASVFVAIAAVSAVLAAITVFLRIRAARRAFRGVLVSGRITKIVKRKDRAYLHFGFEHASRHFDTWRFVHQTAAVKALRVDQQVQVAIDPNRPGSAWIAELFP